jgi:hypothetical protein
MRNIASFVGISLLLACVTLSACGDPFSPESVSGTYQLVSVDGDPIPTDFVKAGTLSLDENGTYSVLLHVQFDFDDETINTTVTDSGTYTLVEPATIQFHSVDGEDSTGTLDGDRITAFSLGQTWVFER